MRQTTVKRERRLGIPYKNRKGKKGSIQMRKSVSEGAKPRDAGVKMIKILTLCAHEQDSF